ncbi:unnamed protein product [Phytomonas sp. Hart1]|nr:unnamed protein product [Phytomonas sp. Hart1]|eukprot:CCW66447.1 unnamed protein product [Phytomonas sp. isolate Hart1]
MSTEQKIWLGVPQLKDAMEDVMDPYTSKVGGHAVLFRDVSNEAARTSFCCPKCGLVDHVSILAQLYAPLDCYDRVLYLLTCAKCGVIRSPSSTSSHPSPKGGVFSGNKKNAPPPIASKPVCTSFCFALRSQNFNLGYYKEMVERSEQDRRATEKRDGAKHGDCANALFQENSNWDDVDEPQSATDSTNDAHALVQAENSKFNTQCDTSLLLPSTAIKEEPSFTLCENGCFVLPKRSQFTGGIPLSLFIEPQLKKENLGSIEDQLRDAQKKYGEAAALDTTSFENDDETPAERCVRKYVERIAQVETQCVRWCPDGEPLRSSLSAINVPLCSLCNGKRRFELQLTSPLVYFLTKDKGEEKNDTLHFSNVLLYTCSNNCYSETTPYAQEYVVVEEEI